MNFTPTSKIIVFIAILVLFQSCKTLIQTPQSSIGKLPKSFALNKKDSLNTSALKWKVFFDDENLKSLIDSALKNNLELKSYSQEILQRKNEVRARKGDYLPFVNVIGGSGFDRPGKYTRMGAIEDKINILDNKPNPLPIGDFGFGAMATWEIDIWKKLRNSKKAAANRYLASMEGRNFLVTSLVGEVAENYYDRLALESILRVIEQNIEIQNNVLKVIIQQKDAAKVSQLAVYRFEAQLMNTKNLEYVVKQKIVTVENRLRFLLGKFEQDFPIISTQFDDTKIETLNVGKPEELLLKRPDIRAAELELEAAKLEVKVARAGFYPSLGLVSGIGLQAFSLSYLFDPESLFSGLLGNFISPLVNRNALKAYYANANARQQQALLKYEQNVLQAYLEVNTQMQGMFNLEKSFDTKKKQVSLLNESINTSINLFNNARADYGEVLFTQREMLEAKLELIEIKNEQLKTKVKLYRTLGGGWE
ncbi:MAG: TolC family protein [Cytophagales bacterium]